MSLGLPAVCALSSPPGAAGTWEAVVQGMDAKSWSQGSLQPPGEAER